MTSPSPPKSTHVRGTGPLLLSHSCCSIRNTDNLPPLAVLEPWDADAFFVSQLIDSAADAEAAHAARLMLGPRVRLAVQAPARELYDTQAYAAAINGSGASVSRGPNVGGVAGYAGFINQLLNRESCLRLVLHAEAASRQTCVHAYMHTFTHTP